MAKRKQDTFLGPQIPLVKKSKFSPPSKSDDSPTDAKYAAAEKKLKTPISYEPSVVVTKEYKNSSFKLSQRDAFSFHMQYLIGHRRNLYLEAYSEQGIRCSKNTKYYIKFEDDGKSEVVNTVLQDVDQFSENALESVKDQLKDAFEDFDACTIIYKNGRKGWVYENQNDPAAVNASMVLYPHYKYNKFWDFKTEKSQRSLANMVDRSAKSRWVVELALGTVDFTYEPTAKTLTVMPYINTPQYMRIDEGQNSEIDEAAEEAAKDKREEERVSKLVTRAAAYLSKKTVNVESEK